MDGVAFYQELRRRWPSLAARGVFMGGTPDARARVTDAPVIARPFGITEVQRVVREVVEAPKGPGTGG